MAWRIGEWIDLDAQIDWIGNAGFDAIGVHTSPGVPGKWQGFDLAALNTVKRLYFRQKLASFRNRELHAPFELTLRSDTLVPVVQRLIPHIEFAGEIDADVLTIHAELPATRAEASAAWNEEFEHLDHLAKQAGIVLGLELMDGFETLSRLKRERIGITLDIGHLYLNAAATLSKYQTLSALVHAVGGAIVHLHVHDHNGEHDHVELGTGQVAIDELMASLTHIGYQGSLCLELNPDRVSVAGIKRSLQLLRRAGQAAQPLSQ